MRATFEGAADDARHAHVHLAHDAGGDAAQREHRLAGLSPPGEVAGVLRAFGSQLLDGGERVLADLRELEGFGALDHLSQRLGHRVGLMRQRRLQVAEQIVVLGGVLRQVHFTIEPMVSFSTLFFSRDQASVRTRRWMGSDEPVAK